MSLFPPTDPPPNPHHPFVYTNGEIRHVGDLGDRYEADVWPTRGGGWRWSATATRPPEQGSLADHYDDREPKDTEADAVTAAVAWLRARCVAVHGRCG